MSYSYWKEPLPWYGLNLLHFNLGEGEGNLVQAKKINQEKFFSKICFFPVIYFLSKLSLRDRL